jgi:hypothetical protein
VTAPAPIADLPRTWCVARRLEPRMPKARRAAGALVPRRDAPWALFPASLAV